MSAIANEGWLYKAPKCISFHKLLLDLLGPVINNNLISSWDVVTFSNKITRLSFMYYKQIGR